MAEVVLTIAGRAYRLACRDGDEEPLRAAGRIVDQRATALAQALGAVPEARLMLMTALSIAGDGQGGHQGGHQGDGQADEAGDRPDIAALAARLESLADLLEQAGGRA